jgi:Na+-driven multidrug efflux pump
MPIVLVAYWICAVPLGYYLAFVRHHGLMCDDTFFCGVRALVTGATTGTIIHVILLAIVVFGFTDWRTEVAKARRRVGTASTFSPQVRQIKSSVIEIQPL